MNSVSHGIDTVNKRENGSAYSWNMLGCVGIVFINLVFTWTPAFSANADEGYCQLISIWADFLPWTGNLNVEQSMSDEFVYCLIFVQIHLT